ncbi:DUF2243 domain-containing protein [Methylocystis parvus]|uniref:DUF2243 domain-containing protein n=1 Tax=Methylocystis parvus TaxID=134 RepID=UPI003C72BCFF
MAERNGATLAGIVLGVGLGGFFDGIVFHQLLQWHHMLSTVRTPDTVANLELNTLWDGLFHAFTWVCVAVGLLLLWRAARRGVLSGRELVGALLMGWGGFNLVEGAVNHLILGIHHVNETAPRSQWAFWDWGFMLWGAAMLVAGWALHVSWRRRYAAA